MLNKLVGFTYNKGGKVSNYIYRRNIQGDIIGIYDSLGNEVGGYAYDAYEKCYVKYKDKSSEEEKTILNTNPFRYKGYYYDNETGLYYLNARYYDPSIGRFISPDVLSILDETKGQINGLNLYMYCNDNPIMYVDPSGHFAFSTLLIGLAVSFLVTWGLSEIFGEQLIGGIGSIVNGCSAILTSMSLFVFGPIGWIIGGIGIIAGLTSIAFGTAEIQESTGYGNWIQDIGVTEELYSNLYVGSNVISSLVTIFGNVYRNSRMISGTSKASKTGKPYSRYYQMDGNKIKSITQYGRGGIPKYRIDILGRPHNNILPHKHIFVINNGYVNKGPVNDINYFLWILSGNWR